MDNYYEDFLNDRGVPEDERELWYALKSYEHGKQPLYEDIIKVATKLQGRRKLHKVVESKINDQVDIRPIIRAILKKKKNGKHN